MSKTTKITVVLIAVLSMLFCVLNVNVFAAQTCGENLTWNIDSEGVLTISGTGEMDNYVKNSATPWYSVKSTISKVIIEDGVLSIGDRAFNNCSNLTEAVIGKDVADIGKRAFYNCGLLETVSLGEGVKTIGDSAFEGCETLSGIEIPASVTEIGEDVFESCAEEFVATVTFGSKAHEFLEELDYYPYEVYCNITITSDGNVTETARLPLGSSYLTPKKPESEKEGYTFSGWTDNSTTYLPSSLIEINSNLNLSAAWVMKTFKVNLECKTGENPVPYDKKYWEPLELGFIPSKDGYSFLGWSLSEDSDEIAYNSGDKYNENKNITLYAVWKELSYIVAYRIPEAQNSIPAQIKMHSERLQLSDIIPKRAGYTFTGWSTKEEAVLPEYKPGDLFYKNGDTVLYAVWKNGIISGDVDNNGTVDMTDLILMIKKNFNKKLEFTQDNTAAMDVYKDTEFNIKDLLKMVQHLSGWQNVILGE